LKKDNKNVKLGVAIKTNIRQKEAILKYRGFNILQTQRLFEGNASK